MRRSLLLLPLCLVVASLAGCGNKGPLFLPPAKPTPSTAPAPISPTPITPATAASSAMPGSQQP